MLFREKIAVYYENHTEHIKAPRGQNAEFYYVRAGGAWKQSPGYVYLNFQKYVENRI
jgi:hypothetical protein